MPTLRTASPEERGGFVGDIQGAAGGASDHQAAGEVEGDIQLLLLLLLQLKIRARAFKF